MALEVNANHTFGFQGHCMRPEQAPEGLPCKQGRFPDDIKAPTSDFLSYCQREGLKQRRHGLWAFWLAGGVGHDHLQHSPSVWGKVSFAAPFVLRLLVESRGAAPPHSLLGN